MTGFGPGTFRVTKSTMEPFKTVLLDILSRCEEAVRLNPGEDSGRGRCVLIEHSIKYVLTCLQIMMCPVDVPASKFREICNFLIRNSLQQQACRPQNKGPRKE